MSEYVERYVRMGPESSWGTYCLPENFDPVEYCLGFDATTTEERIEEEIISSSRQAISRVWTQRAVVGAFESNFLSPRLLYYALGATLGADTASPYTLEIRGTLTLPTFSIERGLKGASDTIYTGYMGCKIDRYELLIEAEEDIVQTVDFVAKDNTFPTYTNFGTVAPSGVFSYDPIAYHRACLVFGTSTIGFRRFRLEINNNLVPRFAGTCAAGLPQPFEIREGLQKISGDFLVDQDIGTYADTFARSRAEGTIQVTLGNDSVGTVTIDLFKIALDEFVDSLRGRDPYEVTFPFVARPTGPSYYDACSVTWENTIAGTIADAPI